MSKIEQIENRLKRLEFEMRELRNETSSKGQETRNSVPWYQQIYGSFDDDPGFDDMIRAGKAIRDSDHGTQPKPRRKSAKKGRR